MSVSSEACWVLALKSLRGIASIAHFFPRESETRFCGVHAVNLYSTMWKKSEISSVTLWGVPRRTGVNFSFAVPD